MKIGCPLKIATKAGTYHSLLGAKKALAKIGYTDLIALMDDNFERIPPAAAMVGDVLALPGEEDLGALTRSEEHTSELQSLMRTSYAVFWLKKKTLLSRRATTRPTKTTRHN